MNEVRQRRPVVRKSKRRSQAEVEASENFKRQVLRMDKACVCSTAFGSQHSCDGPLEIHHAVRQQVLRVHISSLIDLPEPDRLDWLWSPDIGITLCRRAHARHTSRMETVPYEWLPNRVVDFCRDRQITHLLEREHPPLFSDE